MSTDQAVALSDGPRNQRATRRSVRHQGVAGRLSTGGLLAILAVLVALPIIVLLYASVTSVHPSRQSLGSGLTLEWYRELSKTGFRQALKNSVILALGSAALALVLGGFLAFVAARTDTPMKRVIQVAGVVPLFIPTLVGALAWSFLGSPQQGHLNIILRSLNVPFTFNVYSMHGMIFVFGLYYAPYAYIIIFSALTLANPELEEAGQAHGATMWRTLRTITFPLVAPAIFGAGLVVFALALENFPVPAILGSPARIDTLATFIYRLMSGTPPLSNQVAVMAVALVAVILAVTAVQRRYLARRSYTTVSGKGLQPMTIRLGRWRWPVFAGVLVYLLFSALLPILALFVAGFHRSPYIADTGDLFGPSGYSVDTLRRLMGSPTVQDATTNTVIIAVLVVLLGVPLTAFMAQVATRGQGWSRRFVSYAAVAPVAVPALVMGLAILWTWNILPVPLYGSLLILVLAFIVRFIPQSYTSIHASFQQLHPDLEASAMVCGASRLRVAWEITLPLLRSSVVAAALLMFIFSFHEVSAAIFLYTPRTNVLSVLVFQLWHDGVPAQAALICLLYSVGLAVVVALTRRWLSVQGVEARN